VEGLLRHLENTTYLKHLFFAWNVSAKLALVMVVGVIHGIFPFLYERYVSSKIKELDELLDTVFEVV
jgi:hypothetical protein|tara:strand:+ start:307 stop:507 length:201 start_codon:yes stop_codon:yes gene_type:complete